MGHLISEIDRHLGFSRMTFSREDQEYMDGGQKTSDRDNSKEQLALRVRVERRLKRIVRSQRSQILAQIPTQFNDGASCTVSKRTVERSLPPYRLLEQTTYESTIDNCSPSGCTSCLGKKT
ncbi:HTH_Tnp_Tc3_2 domain-containing protein [Trichonephila clavipes]|nr:HTH_Tnp_Tc3_2 domain-containing protein [Trichonephila clavipes]